MAKLAIQPTLIFTIFLVLIFPALLLTASEEAQSEPEFNYVIGGEKGPERWGSLSKEWRACGSGKMQSPIDILQGSAAVVPHLGKLDRSYKPANATLKNNGHAIALEFEEGAGVIRINGIEYQLSECHWHSPSEHTLNGNRFDLEVHMVHETQDGKAAVVGMLYRIGAPDPFLKSIDCHLTAVGGGTGNESVVGIVDPKQILNRSKQYYRYIGSLTTPPCTENVVWTILKETGTVTREQVRSLRKALHSKSKSNARPVQPRNGRTEKLYALGGRVD